MLYLLSHLSGSPFLRTRGRSCICSPSWPQTREPLGWATNTDVNQHTCTPDAFRLLFLGRKQHCEAGSCLWLRGWRPWSIHLPLACSRSPNLSPETGLEPALGLWGIFGSLGAVMLRRKHNSPSSRCLGILSLDQNVPCILEDGKENKALTRAENKAQLVECLSRMQKKKNPEISPQHQQN